MTIDELKQWLIDQRTMLEAKYFDESWMSGDDHARDFERGIARGYDNAIRKINDASTEKPAVAPSIVVLYDPDENELCAYYEQGYRMVGVVNGPYVIRVYMQVDERVNHFAIHDFSKSEPDAMP